MRTGMIVGVLALVLLTAALGNAAILFTESFEGGSLSSGWLTQNVAGAGAAVLVVTNSVCPTGFRAYNGTNFVRFNSFSAGMGAQIRLVCKTPFSTRGINQVIAYFAWTRDTGFTTSTDAVTLQFSSNGVDWVNGATVTRPGTTNIWTRQAFLMPSRMNNRDAVFIAFLFTSRFGNDCHLDDLRIAGYQGPPGIPVLSQFPDMFGIATISQMATNVPYDARTADDFQFDVETKSIKYVQWWFNRLSSTVAPYACNIQQYMHDSVSNAPGDVLQQWMSIPAAECHEATNALGSLLSSFWTELSSPLATWPGFHWWISVQPCLDDPPKIYWLKTLQPINMSVGKTVWAFGGLPNWIDLVNSDFSFQLLVEPDVLSPRIVWNRSLPGQTVHTPVVLTNAIGYDTTFAVSVATSKWPATTASLVTLAKDAITTIVVNVTAPISAPTEMIATTLVTAVSLDDAVYSNTVGVVVMSYAECPGLSLLCQTSEYRNALVSMLSTNPPLEARSADDFIFDTPLTDPIQYLQWWNARFSFLKPSAWTVYLYNHDPLTCMPTNEISSWHIADTNVHWSWLTGIYYECWTELSPPFVPVTGKHYWMTIQAEHSSSNGLTYWAARFSPVALCTGTFRSAHFGATNWRSDVLDFGTPADFAFDFRVVPEPGIAASAVAALALLGARRRHSQ